MDNLTHTLIGLIVGEAVAQSTPASRSGLPAAVRRGLLVTTAVVANNLPDLDLLYTYRGGSGSKLDYMLWHRGYTHTVIGCVVLAVAWYLCVAAWMRWKRLDPSAVDRAALAATALCGTLLHLGMDALNSYGVHPFWPFDNRWLYGDSVFIVEPLYWAAAAPLLFLLRTAAARIALGLVLGASIVLGLSTGYVPPAMCGMLLLAIAALLAVGRFAAARTAAAVSAAAWLAITLCFILAGHLAAQRAEAAALAEFRPDRLVDHVLTPMPVNPVCWDLLLLGTDGDRYSVRHGLLSIAPGLLAGDRCPHPSAGHRVPQEPVAAPDSDAVHWLGSFSMSRADLAAVTHDDCDAAALMRFARVPYARRTGEDWTVGDLRFDRGSTLGMFAFRLAASSAARAPCERAAPWSMPRSDLLRQQAP